jgi:hypothetical protein
MRLIKARALILTLLMAALLAFYATPALAWSGDDGGCIPYPDGSPKHPDGPYPDPDPIICY